MVIRGWVPAGILAVCGFLLFQAGDAPRPGVRPPNIIVVYVDDQGYGDLGCYGSSLETPNLDRLAAHGRRFTDFYVAQPVCSASRAALLTGCYPNRIGIHGALGPDAKHGIDKGEVTLAEVCRRAGYKTAAFGKWHLGHLRPFLPLSHGFDEYFGIPYSNDMWPGHPEAPDAYPALPLIEGNEVVETNPDQRRFTREFGARAVDFIDRHKDGPFFLYLAHPMPHVPLFTSPSFEGRSGAGLYADVTREIDDSVGDIMSALHVHRIEENTLILYASDNGPWLSYGDHAGTTGPLREGKGTTFEGGVRVPMIASWPGRIPSGSTCHEPLMTIDVLPTIAALLDVKLPAHPIDGKDASDLLFGVAGAKSPHDAYYFYYHQNDLEAMRAGRWKLHFPHSYRSMVGRAAGHGGTPGQYDYGVTTPLALYDLGTDIGETRDVAAENPRVVVALQAMADRTRAELGDRLTKVKGAGQRAPGRVAHR